jgi:galactokinase
VLDELLADFRARYGREPEAGARAPGRVNLIGEHTDYNEGLVLPCAIDRDTLVLAARRSDRRFALASREQAPACAFEAGERARRGDWSDYPRAVVAALAESGHVLSGADVAIASAVPPGAGLSSSAALCVALVTAFDALFGLGLSARARAERAHRAESHFAGVPCGPMDPMASALGEAGAALRIDCRSLEVASAPLPEDRLGLLVVHSGVVRRVADGRYAERRLECEAALERAREAGIAPAAGGSLRDLGERDLADLERALPARLYRRARHVIGENERVERAFEALERSDPERVGELLRAGMRSLRADFEVSIPELDVLCALGDATDGVYGSRLTGAGFGGCTLHLVRADAVAEAATAIRVGFERRFGRRPELHALRAAVGARALDLDGLLPGVAPGGR